METTTPRRVFHGALVHSVSLTEIEYLHLALMGVNEHGVITFLDKEVSVDQVQSKLQEYGWDDVQVVSLPRGDFLMPGLIDTHTHAPQYPNLGFGQQYELLQWLSNVTFPTEQKFADASYARRTYEGVVKRLIDCGTTTVCYYGTLHLTTKILAAVCHRKGQRAFVGKCNMDRNSAPSYQEKSASASLSDTKEFVNFVRTHCCSPSSSDAPEVSTLSNGKTVKPPRLSTSLVQPILTPRFAISCSDALLAGLGAMMAKDPTLPLQTHLAENPSEITFTKSLFPFANSYTAIYDHFDLLRNNSVLAHCVHLDEEEMELIRSRNAGISHCPTSNFNLRSGYSKVAEMLDRGIKVSLGTDVSGGFGLGILTALRQASVASKTITIQNRDGLPPSPETSPDRGRSQEPPSIPTTASATATDVNGATLGVTATTNDPASTIVVTSTSRDASTEATVVPASNATGRRSTYPPGYFTSRHLSLETLFYLATMGGAEVCCLEDRVGNFVVGKEFDALLVQSGQKSMEEALSGFSVHKGVDWENDLLERTLVDPFPEHFNPHMLVEPDDSLEKVFEKFLFAGDDRNLGSVFVRGKVIGGARPIA